MQMASSFPLYKAGPPHPLHCPTKKKGNEYKENTLGWTHRRAPLAPALYAHFYNLGNPEPFRSRIMENSKKLKAPHYKSAGHSPLHEEWVPSDIR